MNITRSAVIDTWITLHKNQRLTGDVPEGTFWAWQEVEHLVRTDPLAALQLIIDILAKDNSNVVVENLSAGPLEDLLAIHGSAVIGTVEVEARRNPEFAKLLGGVWQNEMSDEIWRRVQSVWDRRGWDSIPEDD